MTNEELTYAFIESGCYPHQAEFAAQFFAPASSRSHLLLSYPGLGKRFVASAIIHHAVATGLARHILVLAPAALIARWKELCETDKTNIPVLVVDGRMLRERAARQFEHSPAWPEYAIVLVSIELAKKESAIETLRNSQWDLLVVDEAHRLTPNSQRQALVSELTASSPRSRLLLLSATSPRGSSQFDFIQDLEVSHWSRENVRDSQGKPLLPTVQIVWLPYSRTPEEVEILTLLQEYLRPAGTATSSARFHSINLLHTASSSFFALEQRLQRLTKRRHEIIHSNVLSDEELAETDDFSSFDRGDAGKIFSVRTDLNLPTERLLDLLENLQSDSKFERLRQLLGETKSEDPKRACIVTRYADTAKYLETALGEHFDNVSALIGELPIEKRQSLLSRYSERGGVLVVTAIEGYEVPEVSTLILYDAPLNPQALEQSLGRFIRIGRHEPLQVVAFVDERHALVIERIQRKVLDSKVEIGERELQRELFPADE